MATRISDMVELTASINNSSNVFSFVDNTESSANQNKKITFDNFLKFFIENFDTNTSNDLSASSNSQIFPASDTSTTTKVKVYRNLYINSGVTVTPNNSCYGIIFICTGDFINYGTISMTGKGIYSSTGGAGEPYTTINTLYTGWILPLDNPVAKKANNFRFAKEGSIWTNLISPPNKYSYLPLFGTCGSGGYGGGNTYKPGGGGAPGTMFGAGGGGGGAGYGFSPNPATPKGNPGGPGVGMAGGGGGNAGPIYSGDEGGGGGGAGSPAGIRGVSGPLASSQATSGGGGGAGSMCFIVKGNFINYGTITSVGGNGGGGGGYQGGGGGGSGGGSITIYYGGAYYGGTLNRSGGGGGPNAPAASAGASGGSGGLAATNINFI